MAVLLRRLGPLVGSLDDEVLGACERAALGAALALRGACGGELLAVALGSAAEDRVLAMALRAGCDGALRVSDEGIEELDYLAKAEILAAALRHLGVDRAICGDRSQDELSGALGPALAERLGWPHLPAVLEAAAERADDGSHALLVTCRGDGRQLRLRVRGPAVLCIAHTARADADSGRVSTASGTIEQLTLDELGIDKARLAARTQYVGALQPTRSGCNAFIAHDPGELVARLVEARLLK